MVQSEQAEIMSMRVVYSDPYRHEVVVRQARGLKSRQQTADKEQQGKVQRADDGQYRGPHRHEVVAGQAGGPALPLK
jgi:hypothetical protein